MALDKRGSVFYPQFDNGGDYHELLDSLESVYEASPDLDGSVLVLPKNPGRRWGQLRGEFYNKPLSGTNFRDIESLLHGAEGVILAGKGAWTTIPRSTILKNYGIVFVGACIEPNTQIQNGLFQDLTFMEDDLRGADLRKSAFVGQTFFKKNLAGVDFRGCRFENVSIIDSNLRGANFEGATFEGDIQIIGNDVEGASFLGIWRKNMFGRVTFRDNKGHELSDSSTTTVLVHGRTR